MNRPYEGRRPLIRLKAEEYRTFELPPIIEEWEEEFRIGTPELPVRKVAVPEEVAESKSFWLNSVLKSEIPE